MGIQNELNWIKKAFRVIFPLLIRLVSDDENKKNLSNLWIGVFYSVTTTFERIELTSFDRLPCYQEISIPK